MKKSIFATILAVVLAFVLATPAMAAVNSGEQALLDKFNANVDSKVGILLDQERANSFKSWAEKSLNHDDIDLDEAACSELDAKMTEVMNYINDPANGIVDFKTASDHYGDIAKMINQVSEKYGMTVIIDAKKDGEVQINGKTIGTSKPVVNQTGFGVAQTVVVASVATATLAGAYFVARKNRLFA